MITGLRTTGRSGSFGSGVKIADDLEGISRMAAEEIVQQVQKARRLKTLFTMALSGGSTPGKLYTLLADESFVRNRLPWERMHFFWGDERHVPPEHPESNYRMACDSLFDAAPVPPQNIHRVSAEESDAAIAAENYEQELFSFFELKSGQLPRFDCILLGMGPDGHTASLFPGTSALHENQHLVVANWVEQFHTYRITLTVPVLNNADFVIFLVSGEEKAEILREVLEGDFRPDLFPAQLIRPDHGKLLWLVDQAAAGCLTDTIKV